MIAFRQGMRCVNRVVLRPILKPVCVLASVVNHIDTHIVLPEAQAEHRSEISPERFHNLALSTSFGGLLARACSATAMMEVVCQECLA